MAFGDTFKIKEEVLTGEFVTIRPDDPISWVIHNIYVPVGADIELYSSDIMGDDVIIETSGSILGYNFHANNSGYFKLKNVSMTTIDISYDGIVTGVA